MFGDALVNAVGHYEDVKWYLCVLNITIIKAELNNLVKMMQSN